MSRRTEPGIKTLPVMQEAKSWERKSNPTRTRVFIKLDVGVLKKRMSAREKTRENNPFGRAGHEAHSSSPSGGDVTGCDQGTFKTGHMDFVLAHDFGD